MTSAEAARDRRSTPGTAARPSAADSAGAASPTMLNSVHRSVYSASASFQPAGIGSTPSRPQYGTGRDQQQHASLRPLRDREPDRARRASTTSSSGVPRTELIHERVVERCPGTMSGESRTRPRRARDHDHEQEPSAPRAPASGSTARAWPRQSTAARLAAACTNRQSRRLHSAPWISPITCASCARTGGRSCSPRPSSAV